MATEERTANYYTCECGWKRDISISLEWRKRIIQHPLYGRISNIQAARWDVYAHVCLDSVYAHGRAPRSKDDHVYEYGDPYVYTRKIANA